MYWTVFLRIYTNSQSSSTVCSFNNSRPVYVVLWQMRNHYWNIWFIKNSKCQHFLLLKKQPQKWTVFQLFTWKREPAFQDNKVRHPNFLWYTISWNWFWKFELKKDSFFIYLLTKVLWKTLQMRYRKKME